ncbi:PTB domain-containing engulfment adapter protein 1 isoform X2 [Rhinatrema bivittatum]|uniref:PTB domain-containing engulfment adapter protein 1 isoform X2 n=1 Tax=Rhinatrema bivittatum TaxID=194408 RepID=UPI00112B917B|nr:PTB domain-containing engulfment adapter protein 1 isoform X2 [Rhinatrema bivittatum]
MYYCCLVEKKWSSTSRDKTWMHTPEALSKHFIAYNAKFLGSTEVEQPKGTEVVRDAVRKLKFARHIKKSEGQKTPKVELQISIYGVKILEPKIKEVLHNCQLHRISFCADDKTDKRIFTFICKDAESNKHLCYVFDSEKCAEEITLTIGQAFDLAYRKFLESGGKDVETRKQIAGLQKKIQELETENIELKNKVQDLEYRLRISDITTSPVNSVTPKSPSTDIFDMVPFSPLSPPLSSPTCIPSPPVPPRSAEIKRDLFGAEPFDPFSYGADNFPPDIQSKLDEMQMGKKRKAKTATSSPVPQLRTGRMDQHVVRQRSDPNEDGLGSLSFASLSPEGGPVLPPQPRGVQNGTNP